MSLIPNWLIWWMLMDANGRAKKEDVETFDKRKWLAERYLKITWKNHPIYYFFASALWTWRIGCAIQHVWDEYRKLMK